MTQGQTGPWIPIDLPVSDDIYLTFVVNCHDFSDLPSSARVITNLLGLFEERKFKAEFYFTDQLFREYMKKYPEIIERLKRLDMTVSYHLRPPHPVTFRSHMSRYLRSLPEDELLTRLKQYETRGVDPVTGEANRSGSGGYAYIKSVIGYPPPVAGLNAVDPILGRTEIQVLKDMGLKMTVMRHEKQPLAKLEDIILRPADFALSRLPGDIPWYYRPSQLDVPSFFRGKKGFGLVLVHENDFYSIKPGWRAYYYDLVGERKAYPKKPPFDLSSTSEWCRRKSEAEQAALWNKYTEILDYVAGRPEIKVITSRDIIEMVAGHRARSLPHAKAGMVLDREVADLPLYISFIIHNEEDTGRRGRPKPWVPDYDGNESLVEHFSNAMRELGKIASKYGVKIDFAPEWTFINGVRKYDPGFFKEMISMGHQIQAHAHETHVPYGEIKSLLKRFDIPVAPVASGTDESKIQEKMRYFDSIYPEFEVLWGVAVPGHRFGEELTGYVWRPSRENWLLHDPDGKYIYIGHNREEATIQAISTAVSRKDRGKINTYSLVDITRRFKADPGTPDIPRRWTAPAGDSENWRTRLELWQRFFGQLNEMVTSGQVEYRCLMEVKGIFEKYESRLDMSIDLDNIPRSTGPRETSPFGIKSRRGRRSAIPGR